MSKAHKRYSFHVFLRAMMFTALAIILLLIGYFSASHFFGVF